MPRASRSHMLFPIAVSVSQAADACQCRPEEIRELVRISGIPVFALGMRRRILVSDLVRAIKKHWPRAKIAKRLEKSAS